MDERINPFRNEKNSEYVTCREFDQTMSSLNTIIQDLKHLGETNSHQISSITEIVNRNTGLIYGVTTNGKISGGIYPMLTGLTEKMDNTLKMMEKRTLSSKQKWGLVSAVSTALLIEVIRLVFNFR